MKASLIICFPLLLVSAFMLTACGPEHRVDPTLTPTSSPTHTQEPPFTTLSTSLPTRSSTLTPGPTSTSSPTATSSRTQSAVPTPVFIKPAGTDGNWIRYNHTLYGFSFSAPPGWIVSEVGTNFIHISSPTDHNIKLTIGVRWLSEDIRIQRTGVPEGDIVPAGEVAFFGENISKGILVYQGRDKLILYHLCSEIKVGERVFTLGFSDFKKDYYAIDLAAADVEIADAMVESFGYPK